jgi:hypothetical protein
MLLGAFALLMLACSPLVITAQEAKPPTSWAGKYEGLAKGPEGDVKMTLEILDEAGKLSGQAATSKSSYKFAKGELVDGVLTLELEPGTSKGKLTLRQKDDKLVGELLVDGKAGPVEFRKVAKDEISGEWDASADAQGQPFPFTLVLKLDGEKVTGSSSSQLGNSEISSGTWKDGKLSILINGTSGAISLMATIDGGKLIGDYDFAGQLQGKWVAVRKK